MKEWTDKITKGVRKICWINIGVVLSEAKELRDNLKK